MGEHIYCPLAPCLPRTLSNRPERVTDEMVRQSRSFCTHEAYWRHIETGHFIAKANGPLPYCLDPE